jgi:hypothetical protein
MKGDFIVDILSGIFPATSPWLFGFPEIVYRSHLVLGIVEIGLMKNPGRWSKS